MDGWIDGEMKRWRDKGIVYSICLFAYLSTVYYIYIYDIYVWSCVYIYRERELYIYIYRERERVVYVYIYTHIFVYLYRICCHMLGNSSFLQAFFKLKFAVQIRVEKSTPSEMMIAASSESDAR